MLHFDCTSTGILFPLQESTLSPSHLYFFLCIIFLRVLCRVLCLSQTLGKPIFPFRTQMVTGYEHQLKMLSLNAPAGLSVRTALHAASVGEERFNKGDCRGSSRLFRCTTT